jgi:D-serine deaminase-like pyridoxal phosphate-dependent protein
MVDCAEHLEPAAAAVRDAGGRSIRVCLDVDAGWWSLGARVKIGARRSPMRTPEQAAGLARAVAARPELALDGLMSYEAQIAGVGDRPPGRARRSGRCSAPRRGSWRAAVETAPTYRGEGGAFS